MSQPPGTPDPNDPAAGRRSGPLGHAVERAAAVLAVHPADRLPPQQPAVRPAPYGQQPGYGYGQQPGYGHNQAGLYGYGAPPRTNGKATAALWTGIGSIVLTLCCGLGILGVVPIVLGVKARGEIRATGGQQEGDGMALAGIITGAVAIVLSLVFIAVIVVSIVSGTANFDGSSQTGRLTPRLSHAVAGNR